MPIPPRTRDAEPHVGREHQEGAHRIRVARTHREDRPREGEEPLDQRRTGAQHRDGRVEAALEGAEIEARREDPSRPRSTATAPARSASSSASAISPSISTDIAFTLPSSIAMRAIPSSIDTRVRWLKGWLLLDGRAPARYRPITIISMERGDGHGGREQGQPRAHRDAALPSPRLCGTGLLQILAESGAPKGSLYHYFPSGKEAIGEAAVDLAGRMIAELLGDLAARLRGAEGVRARVLPHDGGLDGGVGLPLGLSRRDDAARDGARVADDHRDRARASSTMWIRIVAGVLARSGLERREARSRAQLVIAAMEGALILARVQAVDATDPRCREARLTRALPRAGRDTT
jgi:TetR/AcrR family transcriptional repressor of lmrAB and yxaGH operons